MKTSFSIEVLIIAALICPAGSSAQWTPTSGPTYLNPIGFLSVAVQGDTILAGGYQGGGIFRSTDDGHTWTEVLSTGYVYSLTVYHEFVYAGNYAGIYRSSDFGETWVSSSSGLPDQVNVNVTSIAGKDSFLFAGTDFGVYRSGDSGSTWTSMSNGLTPVFGSRTVFSIVASQGVLLAATYDGVYRSSDDGQSWSSSNSGIPTYGNGSHYDVRSFLVDGIYVFAGTSGIYRSRENGLNWVAENSGLPINGSNPYFQMVYSLARSGNRILAGTDQSGVYVSTDDGGTWNAMLHSPPSYAYVFGFAVRSTDVFAATLGGIFRIGISDTDWTPVLTGYTRVASTFALGSTATKLLVSGNGGTYSSTDGGAHWPRIDSIPGDPTFNHFATAGSLIYASSNSHIHRSSDGGLTWTVSDSGINSYFINSVITKGTDVFAVSGFDGQFGEFGGVFRSTDQGISWFRAGLKDTAVLSLMPLGEDLFVGTLHGIFQSPDDGGTWVGVNDGIPPNTSVYSFAATQYNVYAATSDGMYLSSDFGNSWSPSRSGLPSGLSTYYSTLLSLGNQVFLGTNDGIYQSVDGLTWQSIGAGLTGSALTVHSLAVLGGNIFAATDNGVWSRSLGEVSPSAELPVQENWNLLSIPVRLTDYRKSVIFPTSVSKAFILAGGYEKRDSLQNGQGFWLKFSNPASVPLFGTTITADTFLVAADWNMIGSISIPVPAISITSDPPGMIVSQFYRYSSAGGYAVADTIQPGLGYWVKVSQSGKLILSTSSGITAANTVNIIPTAELPPPPPAGEISNVAPQIPTQFALEQNYPNPFNPSTVIRFQLPVASYVTLNVYDLLGQEVQTLVEAIRDPGYVSVEWDGRNLPSGMYLCRFEAAELSHPTNTFTQVRKMLLLK